MARLDELQMPGKTAAEDEEMDLGEGLEADDMESEEAGSPDSAFKALESHFRDNPEAQDLLSKLQDLMGGEPEEFDMEEPE